MLQNFMNYDGKLYELNKKIEEYISDQKWKAFGDEEFDYLVEDPN